MSPEIQEHLFTVGCKADAETIAKLDHKAELTGVGRSEYLRQLIANEVSKWPCGTTVRFTGPGAHLLVLPPHISGPFGLGYCKTKDELYAAVEKLIESEAGRESEAWGGSFTKKV